MRYVFVGLVVGGLVPGYCAAAGSRADACRELIRNMPDRDATFNIYRQCVKEGLTPRRSNAGANQSANAMSPFASIFSLFSPVSTDTDCYAVAKQSTKSKEQSVADLSACLDNKHKSISASYDPNAAKFTAPVAAVSSNDCYANAKQRSTNGASSAEVSDYLTTCISSANNSITNQYNASPSSTPPTGVTITSDQCFAIAKVSKKSNVELGNDLSACIAAAHSSMTAQERYDMGRPTGTPFTGGGSATVRCVNQETDFPYPVFDVTYNPGNDSGIPGGVWFGAISPSPDNYKIIYANNQWRSFNSGLVPLLGVYSSGLPGAITITKTFPGNGRSTDAYIDYQLYMGHGVYTQADDARVNAIISKNTAIIQDLTETRQRAGNLIISGSENLSQKYPIDKTVMQQSVVQKDAIDNKKYVSLLTIPQMRCVGASEQQAIDYAQATAVAAGNALNAKDQVYLQLLADSAAQRANILTAQVIADEAANTQRTKAWIQSQVGK